MKEDTSIRTIYDDESYIKEEHDPNGSLPGKGDILKKKSNVKSKSHSKKGKGKSHSKKGKGKSHSKKGKSKSHSKKGKGKKGKRSKNN